MKKPVFESKKKPLYYHNEKVDMLKIVNYFNYLLNKHINKEFDTIEINLSKGEFYVIRITFFTLDCNNTTVDLYDFYSIEKTNILISFIEDIFKGKYKTIESIKIENDLIKYK